MHFRITEFFNDFKKSTKDWFVKFIFTILKYGMEDDKIYQIEIIDGNVDNWNSYPRYTVKVSFYEEIPESEKEKVRKKYFKPFENLATVLYYDAILESETEGI